MHLNDFFRRVRANIKLLIMNPVLQRINFTRNESRVILFSIVLLLSGLLINYFKGNSAEYSGGKTFARTENTNNIPPEKNPGNPGSTLTSVEENTILENESAEDSLEAGNKINKSKKEDKLAGVQINLNTASKEQLKTLPGVGDSTAEKIIAYRENHGGFNKIEDLMKIKGIGKKKFGKLKPYITVN
jgi:comEA protein